VLVPANEVGWYAAAYRIIGIPGFIPTMVIAPLFPALSRSAHEPAIVRRTVAQTLRALLILMIGACAATVVAAPLIPTVLGWPSDFQDAVPLMMILAIHVPVVAVDMVLGVVLMAIHRESRWVVVGLIAAVFNITTNLTAIPVFEMTTGNGAVAAAIATVATEVLMAVGAIVLIPKHLLDPSIAWVGARLAAAAGAGIVVGLAVQPLLLARTDVSDVVVLISVAAAGSVYAACAFALRVTTTADVREMLVRIKWPKR
jgi:O-antigen/teichoic acid export membrane protein